MSRRVGAFGLTVALLAVLAAAVIPTCADSLCCALTGEKTVAPEMPCCEPSISSRNFDMQPAKVEARQASPDAALHAAVPPAALKAAAPSRLRLVRVVPSAGAPPSPPLFLRNAQFLI